jgi:serine/threonine protein kinase
VLDRYRLVRLIGHGGFGTVWLARDEHLGREVAIKRIARGAVLSSPEAGEGWDAGRRTLREAQAAGRLNHPGIVALFEAGDDDEAFYLVSELVRGRTLGELQSGHDRLSDADVLEVGLALCEALAHAHSCGIVHRDVKPHNVIVPEDPVVVPHAAKLTDFGVARIVGEDALTRTGDVVGTLAYMAPEQAEGRKVTAASDLYSLALVLYEALAGVNPLRGAGPAATARRVGARLPSLRRARRDLPAALCQAIDAALSPAPRARGSVIDLRRALLEALPDLADTPRHARETLRRARMRDDRPPRPSPDWSSPESGPRPGSTDPPAGVDGDASPGRRRFGLAPGRVEVTLGARGAGGLAGGALVGLALAGLGPAPSVDPVLAGATAALVIALLPRVGWLVAAAFVVTWLAGAGQGGLALLVALAVAAIPFGLPRSPWLWSLPALAPALGAIGLAGAFPALAGQARTVARRALLGALGYWCLALAETATGTRLLFGPAPAASPGGTWRGSALSALSHAVGPLLSDPAIAVAGVWALAAVVLPWVVRGRSAAADFVLGAAWAGGLSGATTWVARAAGQLTGTPAAVQSPPRGALIAALVGAMLAVAARALRPKNPAGPSVASAEPDHPGWGSARPQPRVGP